MKKGYFIKNNVKIEYNLESKKINDLYLSIAIKSI